MENKTTREPVGALPKGRLIDQLLGREELGDRPSDRPRLAVYTCIDERIVPEAILGSGPRELCCVRLAGHVVIPEAVTSIEMALSAGCRRVLVLGHADCRAVARAWGGHGFDPLTRHVRWALRGLRFEAGPEEAVEANVRHTVEELTWRLGRCVMGAVVNPVCRRFRLLDAERNVEMGMAGSRLERDR
jgi:hypothetical protein